MYKNSLSLAKKMTNPRAYCPTLGIGMLMSNRSQIPSMTGTFIHLLKLTILYFWMPGRFPSSKVVPEAQRAQMGVFAIGLWPIYCLGPWQPSLATSILQPKVEGISTVPVFDLCWQREDIFKMRLKKEKLSINYAKLS